VILRQPMTILAITVVIDVLVGLIMGWRWVDSLFTEVVLIEDRPEGGTVPEFDGTPLLPRDAEDIPITHDWDAGLEELVASYAASGQTA
jgi:hypothetical protein